MVGRAQPAAGIQVQMVARIFAAQHERVRVAEQVALRVVPVSAGAEVRRARAAERGRRRDDGRRLVVVVEVVQRGRRRWRGRDVVRAGRGERGRPLAGVRPVAPVVQLAEGGRGERRRRDLAALEPLQSEQKKHQRCKEKLLGTRIVMFQAAFFFTFLSTC